jgi:hypothetical protein
LSVPSVTTDISPQARVAPSTAPNFPPQLPSAAQAAPVTPPSKTKSAAEHSDQFKTSATTPPPQFSIQSNIAAQTSIISHSPTPAKQHSPQPITMSTSRLSTPGNLSGQNGTNGVLSPPLSPKALFRSKGRLPSFTSSRAPSGNFSTTMRTFTKRSGNNSNKIGLVQESAAALKKRSMAELGAGVYQSVSNVSYVNFLEWIRSERLTTLPHKGSRWDKVLIRALYFAEQLHNFEKAIQGFALDSSAAAAIGYGHAQLLLEVRYPSIPVRS